MTRLALRIHFVTGSSIGPGKIQLLELVRETGSISAAARAMDMSYRRAWLLVDDLNKMFRQPMVETKLGGKAGGGAMLTDFGATVVGEYRAMEREAATALAVRLVTLEDSLPTGSTAAL